MFLLLAVFTLIVAFVLYTHINSPRRRYKLPPGPKGLPILGNIFQLSQTPHESYVKWQNEFGPIYHLIFGSNIAFVMSDIKLIKECYNENIFTGRFDRMVIHLLSKGKNGVLMSEGQTWSDQRRFTLRHLRDFGFGKTYMESLVMDEVNDFIEGLKKDGAGNQPVEINERFDLAVVNAIWTIVAGKRFQQDDKDKLELLKDIDRNFGKLTLASIVYLMAPSLLKIAPGPLGFTKLQNAADGLHTMLKQVIKEHVDTLSEDPSNTRDFIDSFLFEIKRTEDVKSSFFKEEGLTQLCAVIGDLFFAGSETTSTTLTWTVLYLSTHPEVQKKLQEQIDHVTGKTRAVAVSDRASLPYAEACVLEILRKSSIVVTGVFHTATQSTTFQGYDVPKGSWLMANQYGLHHDPAVWGDPENFRPERFLSKDGLTVVKNESLIPFSIGKRSCIGESLARDEIFLFMTNIFQRFSVIPDPTRPIPSLDAKAGFLRKPEDFFVILKDRLA